MDEDKQALLKRQSLKPVAFAATVFSTVAVTASLIAFSLILHYVQTLESNVQLDLDFCKVRVLDSKRIWSFWNLLWVFSVLECRGDSVL
jgi:hypothetical protein